MYFHQLENLMAQKSGILLKAQSLTTLGLPETAQPLWASAASYEERIAALLDAHGMTGKQPFIASARRPATGRPATLAARRTCIAPRSLVRFER